MSINTTYIPCQECKEKFLVFVWMKEKRKFCCFLCSAKYRQKHNPLRNPNLRGNKFRVGIPPSNKGKPGLRGKDSPSWVPPLRLECAFCGAVFFLKPWEVRTRSRSLLAASGQKSKKYCSIKCYIGDRSGTTGKADDFFRGGKIKYYGADWKTQRQLAINRDNGICQDCGKYQGNTISVHHIKQFHKYKRSANANRLKNLVCLCRKCHMARHAKDHIKTRTKAIAERIKSRNAAILE